MERNKKVLIYLDSVSKHCRKLRQVDKILRKYNNPTLVIGSDVSELTNIFMKNNNVSVIDIKDYIDDQFLDNVDKNTLLLSRSMANFKKRYLYYKNISLVGIIDSAIYLDYFDIMEDFFILDGLIRREKPDTLFKFADFTPYSIEIENILKKKYNINIKIINLKNVFFIKIKEAIVQLIFIFSFFVNIWLIRDLLKYYFLGLAKGSKGGVKNSKNREIPGGSSKLNNNIRPLFVLDNGNFSCIDTVLPLMDRADTKVIITNSLDTIRKKGHINYDKLIYLPTYNRSFFNLKCIPYLFYLFDFRMELKKNIFQISGFDFSPFLLKSLNGIFLKDFPRIIPNLIALEKIIINNSYNFIILPSDCRELEESCVKVADNNAISSLVIQHGITGRTFGFIPINATKIAVWGSTAEKWFKKNYADMNKVMVTGCPRFDYLINNSFSRGAILNKYKIPDKKIVLVASTQMFGEYAKDTGLIVEIFKLLSSMKNTILIIKLHQSEKKNKYDHILNKLSITNSIVTQDADLNEMIFISDFIITYASTSPLHVMILNKPFVLLGSINKLYDSYPELIKITSKEEVYTKLKPLLYKERCSVDYDTLLENFIYKNDGLATDRVISLINHIYAKAMQVK